ncbi:hypothetical protein OC845_001533 [Tilletia horrida]|nr:hypothetical protein OC845_001533 [Tilletia horrida]
MESYIKQKRKLLAVDSFDLRDEAQKMLSKHTRARASKRQKLLDGSLSGGACQQVDHDTCQSKRVIAVLHTLDASGREHAIDLQEDVVLVIGREPSCDYVLRNPRASRKHARILSQISDATQTPYVVCEDTSKAGTFVNGAKIDQKFVLSDGDEVHLAGENADFVLEVLAEVPPNTAQQGPVADIAPSEPSHTVNLITTLDSIAITDRLLGSGSYAQVFLGYDTRNDKHKQIAIKRQLLRKRLPGTHVTVMGELEVLKKIRHPNINSIHGYGEDGTHLYMALELLHSDLFSLISQRGPLQLPSAKFIFFQLLKAVKYLHENGISHRDIKVISSASAFIQPQSSNDEFAIPQPENIFLESAVSSFPRVCLGDFGLAHRLPQSSQLEGQQPRTRSFCGTLGYLAPEVLRQYITEEGYDPRALDMWSCGVTFFFALNATHPFDHLAAIPKWGQIWELVRAELIANAELDHDDLMAVSDILSQSLASQTSAQQGYTVDEGAFIDASPPECSAPNVKRSSTVTETQAQEQDVKPSCDTDIFLPSADIDDHGQDDGAFAQERAYIRSIMTGQLSDIPVMLTKDPAGQDLLRGLLQMKLESRPTAAQALEHDWFESAQPSLNQMYEHRVLGRGIAQTRSRPLTRQLRA